MVTETHDKLQYPMGATFGTLPSDTDLYGKTHIVFDPEGKGIAHINHKDQAVSQARASWIAQQLTLALFREQNPGCDVPIPQNEEQAALMALVAINYLRDHGSTKLKAVCPSCEKHNQGQDDGVTDH